MPKIKTLILGTVLLGALFGWLRWGPGNRLLGGEPGKVRIVGDTVEVTAVVRARSFDPERSEMGGYHLVVWERGGASAAALLRSSARDVDVLNALESLGGKPGDALSIASWDERHDPDSTEPDKVIEGPRVEIQVRIPGKDEPLSLDEILYDPGGRGFDFRLGGHRANIPRWRSGCVVCLYSCPGGKVGNAGYTVRDFVQGKTRFSVRPGVLPADGTPVTLLFRLVPESSA